MKRSIQLAAGILALAITPLAAQLVVPEMAYDVAIEPLKLPPDLNFGEVAGIATNSKGDAFVYTRTGHPTLSLGTARPFAYPPSVPEELAALCNRATALDPSQRPASALEFRRALLEHLQHRGSEELAREASLRR